MNSTAARLNEAGAAGRRFTTFQWYFWRVGNTVHLCGYSSRELTRAEFDELTEHVLTAIPFMRAAADTKRQVFGEPAPGSETAARLYEKQPRLDVAMSAWLEARRGGYENNGRPCYLARCVSAAEPDANGMRSLFYIQTSHAIAEGLDVSALVRGRAKGAGPGGPTRRTTRLASRLFHDLVAVFAAPAVLLAANLLPSRKGQEGFQVVSFDRAAIRTAANRFGIGQKALCFALVTAGLTPRRLFHRLAYITLPSTSGPGEFDGHIAFHIRQTAVRAGRDFPAFARRVDTALHRTDTGFFQAQYIYFRIGAFYRRIEPALPFLFGERFRRFFPFDILLSMMPPVLPSGRFGELVDGPFFAGTAQAGGNVGVFAPCREAITLTLWLDGKAAARLPDMMALSEANGIGCEARWG